MTIDDFSGRLGLVQRVLPSYRVPFFEALSDGCAGGLSLFAGQPRPDESIATSAALQRAQFSPARNFHFQSTSSPFYFCYQAGLIDWLASWDPHALIVEANFRYLSSYAGFRWMKKRKRPILGWGLGVPSPGGPLSVLRQGFLRQFDAVIAYSRRGAEQYAACGVPANKIFVAPNAVASAPTRPLPARPASFAAQPGLLFVGRLQARKRIPALLGACAALPAPLKPHLVIVGDGPELGNLRALAHELYPSAEFVGAKQGAELEPYFLSADLFVLPGTGGLAVQQAMSYGLPVIVARGDGTQDDLVRPANGWQIPSDDDEALTTCLREALSDVARLRSMGAESYRIVAEQINLQKMVSVFLEALNSVKNSNLG
jgi:glycosyltransferase involved in cell wall biosynthesis